jgi:hypothetical protein
MKSILDPSFRYTPSAKTDLRKTFARIRREQRRAEVMQTEADAKQLLSVVPIRPRKIAAS